MDDAHAMQQVQDNEQEVGVARPLPIAHLLTGLRHSSELGNVLAQSLGAVNYPPTEIKCTYKLLEHLCGIGLGKAFVAYRLINGTAECFAWGPSTLDHEESEALQDALRDRCLQRPRPESNLEVEDLSAPDLQELPSIDGWQPLQGYLIWTSAIPLWLDQRSALAVWLLEPQSAFHPTWGADILRTVLPGWANSFVANLAAYERERKRFLASGRGVSGWRDFFPCAEAACPWLDAATVCADWDFALPRSRDITGGVAGGEEQPARNGIQEALTALDRFCDQWHGCQERHLPCQGEGHQAHAVVEWFKWRFPPTGADARAADQIPPQAVQGSLDLLQRQLAKSEPARTGVDPVLWRAALIDQLRGLAESGPLPHRTTEAYLDSKDHLGRFAAMVLTDMPHTAETIDAAIWSLRTYAYSVLGVDPRLHLASHLRHGARAEPSLHMMKEFYRDHFFHTIEVCLLGHLLMKLRRAGTRLLTSRAFRADGETLRQWYLAALLHDFGYAVDVTKGLRDWLDFFVSGPFDTLKAGIKGALKAMGGAAGADPFADEYGFEDLADAWEDHGLVGAHHLHTLIEETKPPISHATDQAIRAIAVHNCQEIPIRYARGVTGLPALLCLCDLLQTWHRPHFPHFSMGPAWMMSVLGGRQRVAPLDDDGHVTLRANVRFEPHGEEIVPVFDDFLVLRLVYDHTVNRDSYVFNVWLDATRSLQRIDFRGLPHDVLVQIQTPVWTSPSEGRPVRHIDRLRDAGNDTHMAYMHAWLRATEQEQDSIPKVDDQDGNRALTAHRLRYCFSAAAADDGRRDPSEMLSFSLRKMDGTMDLMTEGLDRFRRDLKHWRRYHEDRTYEGDYSPWHHKSRS